MLGNQEQFDIVAEATKGSDMLPILQGGTKVDLLMIDIMMPEMDGYTLSVKIRQQYPEINILVLSMNSEGALMDKMIEHAGINAYLLNTTGKDELTEAIQTIARGENYFTPEALSALHSFRKIKQENLLTNLTSREREIIRCMNGNLTDKQISDQLFISEQTVETHRKNIFRKTNTHSVFSLMAFLKKQKIELSAD